MRGKSTRLQPNPEYLPKPYSKLSRVSSFFAYRILGFHPPPSRLLQLSAVRRENSCSGEIYPHQMIIQSRFSSVPKIHSAASRHSQCQNIYPKPYSKSSWVISFFVHLIFGSPPPWQMREKSTRLQPNPEYKPYSKASRVIPFVAYLIFGFPPPWQMRGKSTRLQPNPEYLP